MKDASPIAAMVRRSMFFIIPKVDGCLLPRFQRGLGTRVVSRKKQVGGSWRLLQYFLSFRILELASRNIGGVRARIEVIRFEFIWVLFISGSWHIMFWFRPVTADIGRSDTGSFYIAKTENSVNATEYLKVFSVPRLQ